MGAEGQKLLTTVVEFDVSGPFELIATPVVAQNKAFLSFIFTFSELHFSLKNAASRPY